MAVEIHCDAMASALSSKQAREATALSGTDPPSSARMASGAGKTHLAERTVDHEQLVETLPPPPPRDAVMIARRISMRIADGGPKSRLSGNQRSPWQVRCSVCLLDAGRRNGHVYYRSSGSVAPFFSHMAAAPLRASCSWLAGGV